MANFFDQFDGASASAQAASPVAVQPQPPAAQPGGAAQPAANFFDQFDQAAPGGGPSGAAPAPQQDDGSTPMVVTVHPSPPPASIEVDPHDPEAAQRAWDTLTGKADPSKTESLVRGARQGLGLNFADEARGVAEASGLPSWLPGAQIVGAARLGGEAVAPSVFGHSATDRYNATVDQERASDAAAQAANPGSYLSGELAGGVGSMLVLPELKLLQPAADAGVAARVGSAVGNLAATGALAGGIAGAGGAEGGIADRGLPAIEGAGIGAALTPVIAGGARAIGAGGKVVAGFVGDHIAASRNPQQVADRVVQRALGQDATVQPMLPGADVVGNSPAAVARMTDAQTIGQPLTLADVAGPNTQAIVGNAARTPGPAKAPVRQFLEERQVGTDVAPSQGERVSGQLGMLLGDGSAADAADALIARRRTNADPLYDRAYRVRLNYGSPQGQTLLGLLDRVPNETKAAANKILTISDREGHQLVWNPSPNADGNFTLDVAPNGRQWQYIKEGLDTTIEANRDPITRQLNTLGGAVQGLKTQILNTLDRMNPAYAEARRAYAGDSELLDAIRAGQDAFKPSTSAETVRNHIAGMTAGEQELYRLGAVNAAKNTIANRTDGTDISRVIFGTKANRDKFLAMAPDMNTQEAFAHAIHNEAAMFRTRAQAVGNSATAGRVAEDADMAHTVDQAMHVGKSIIKGDVWGVLAAAARTMTKVNPELRGRVLDEARKIILNPDPAAVRAFQGRVAKTPGLGSNERERVIALVQAGISRSAATKVTSDRRAAR